MVFQIAYLQGFKRLVFLLKSQMSVNCTKDGGICLSSPGSFVDGKRVPRA